MSDIKKPKMELFKLTKEQIKRRIILLIVLLVLLVFAIIGDLNLGVSFYNYESSKLPSEFDGYRIVQISDFHNSNFGPSGKAVADKTRELDPDIIVITGDFIDSRNTNMAKAIECARLLCEIAPVYYINGNHECRFDIDEQIEFYRDLQSAGVVVLIDSVRTLYSPSSEDSYINLIGLDDFNRNMLQELDIPDSFNLVLAHKPQYIDEYAAGGADLVLSGHAHGGQFRLPFINVGFVAPDQGFFPKYTSGIYEYEDATMVVSRGIGNSALPVRIFNNPEIVVVDLHVA